MADEQSQILSDNPSRSELALVARAARERWPISEQTRRDLVDKLTTIALGKNQPARTQLAAIRALIAADRLNTEGNLEEPDGLFSGLARECAIAGVTVQERLEELRAQPGAIRRAQELVFGSHTDDAGS